MPDVLDRIKARVDQITRCAHRPEVRCRPDRAGRPRYVRQCTRCGERLGTAVSRSDAPPQAPPFDEAAEARRQQQRNDAWGRVHAARKDAELAAWRAEHARYLQTPDWRRRRAAVMRRAQHTCEGCGVARATQVHHLHYRRWRREMLFDLVAVCDGCHELIHQIDRERAS